MRRKRKSNSGPSPKRNRVDTDGLVVNNVDLPTNDLESPGDGDLSNNLESPDSNPDLLNSVHTSNTALQTKRLEYPEQYFKFHKCGNKPGNSLYKCMVGDCQSKEKILSTTDNSRGNLRKHIKTCHGNSLENFSRLCREIDVKSRGKSISETAPPRSRHESNEEEEEEEEPVNGCSVTAMEVTVDGDITATTMETVVSIEKSVSDICVHPQTTKGRPGQPRNSQSRANLWNPESTISEWNQQSHDMFSVTDSSVSSGCETLDNSISTFHHPTGTKNYLKKRKSEVISSESSLESKSSENISFSDSFGREHRTSMQSESSSFQKLVGQTNRFNAYLALPNDPVRAWSLLAKDLDVTLIHLLPKCLMSLKIHEQTTIILMEGCIEIKNDSLIWNRTVLDSKIKQLEIEAGRNIQIGNGGSCVAKFKTTKAKKSIILPEDQEKQTVYNAYKARPDDPVNAQQLLSEKDLRISWIILQPMCYLPLKIHDPTTIVLFKGKINVIKDLTASHFTKLNSSMESIEIKTGSLIHLANFENEIAKFQVVEFLK